MTHLEKYSKLSSNELWDDLLELHMLNTGASEAAVDDYCDLKRAVQWRRDNWLPNLTKYKEFDDKVLELIDVVLKEEPCFSMYRQK